MPNPIKYNTSSETLALKKGNFWIGTGDVDKGPTSSSGYYNGISPVSSGYTVYIYNSQQPGSLSYFSAANDASLISQTNALAGTSYTSATQCLVYFAGQTDKMVLNCDYGSIITSGMVLNLDAGFTPSYPQSGTSLYDLGPSGFTGTLTNGPTFSSDTGGCIFFDGTDDYVELGNNILFNFTGTSFTCTLWANVANYGAPHTALVTRSGNYFHYGWTLGINSSGYPWLLLSSNGTSYVETTSTTLLTKNIWYFFAFGFDSASQKQFVVFNGTRYENTQTGTNPDSTLNLNLFRHIDPLTYTQGKLSNIQMYNRALSSNEILQNNYTTLNSRMIVTNGLVLNLQAGNPSSFTSGTTTWYDVSGNNNNGTLTNGPTFNSSNGGSIVLDGTNDYIPISTTNFSFGSASGTLSAWVMTNTASGQHWIISYGTANTSQCRFIGIVNDYFWFGGYNNDDISASGVSTSVWFNIVGVYTGTQALLYVNGVLVSGPTSKSWNTIANNAQIGRQTNSNEYWNGKIANVSVYNRDLSASEVLQNYNVQKSLFGL